MMGGDELLDGLVMLEKIIRGKSRKGQVAARNLVVPFINGLLHLDQPVSLRTWLMLRLARRTLHNEDGWEAVVSGYLSRQPNLRVAIQRECVWSVPADKVFESLEHLRDTCDALGATGADIRVHLTNLERERPRDWVRLWGELVHYGKVHGELSRFIDCAREQGTRNPALGKVLQGVLKSRRHRSLEKTMARCRARLDAKRQERTEFHELCKTSAHTIRKGENLPMLRTALEAYFDLLVEKRHGCDSPLERVAHVMGPDRVPDVRAGIEAAAFACADKMSARDIAIQSANWEFGDHALLLLALCLERTVDNGDFRDLPPHMVESALAAFHLSPWAEKHPSCGAARSRLEGLVLSDAYATTDYFKTILVPFSSSDRDLPPGVDLLLLDERHLASTREVALEWAGKGTDMPERLRECLLTALVAGDDRVRLLELTRRLKTHARRGDDVLGGIAFALEFMCDFARQRHRLRETAKCARHSVLSIVHPPVYTSCIGHRDAMSPAQSHFVVSVYARAWPRVYSLHFEWEEEGRNPWKVSNFLLGRIRALGNDTSNVAEALLRKLLKSGMMGGYSEEIRAAKKTQDRLRKEMAGTPLEPEAVGRLLGAGPKAADTGRRAQFLGAQHAEMK